MRRTFKSLSYLSNAGRSWESSSNLHSTRAYRLKLDEWGFRKNKTSKALGHRSSEDASGPKDHVELSTHYSASRGAELILPTSSNRAPQKLSADNFQPSTYNILAAMLAYWSPDAGFMERFLALVSKDHFDFAIFSAPTQPQKSLFDLIYSQVPLKECLTLGKALLMVSFDVIPLTPPSSRDFHWWAEACKEPLWETAKKKLQKMELKWMSNGAAELLHEAALQVIGESSLDVHKAKLDQGHGLKRKEFEFEVYEYHRNQYMEILRDFQERKVELDKVCHMYLLDLMEWEAGEWGSEIEDEDKDDGDDECDFDLEMSERDAGSEYFCCP